MSEQHGVGVSRKSGRFPWIFLGFFLDRNGRDGSISVQSGSQYGVQEGRCQRMGWAVGWAVGEWP